MRKLLLLLSISVSLFACSDNGSKGHGAGHAHDTSATKTPNDTSRKSIPSETRKRLADTDIIINYHSPAVRGRVIWGGLVAYDAVWVTGAHNATTLEIGKDFQVGDKTIPAGKYALFTIPGKEEWIVIINKNWDQHLADEYAQSDDVARINVKPQVTQELEERLKYEVEQTGERIATISIAWEKLRVPFHIEIKD